MKACRLMVVGKFAAAAAAHPAAARAFAGGKSIHAAVSLALAPVRRRVWVNHQRLAPGELTPRRSLDHCQRRGRLTTPNLR